MRSYEEEVLLFADASADKSGKQPLPRAFISKELTNLTDEEIAWGLDGLRKAKLIRLDAQDNVWITVAGREEAHNIRTRRDAPKDLVESFWQGVRSTPWKAKTLIACQIIGAVVGTIGGIVGIVAYFLVKEAAKK